MSINCWFCNEEVAKDQNMYVNHPLCTHIYVCKKRDCQNKAFKMGQKYLK